MARSARPAGTAGVLNALGACALMLTALPGIAQQEWSTAELLGQDRSMSSGSLLSMPLPLSQTARFGGLSFDLGGSEKPKLQLRLDQPLFMDATVRSGQNVFGSSESAISSIIGLSTSETMDLTIGAAQFRMDPMFQSLGSIHCQNGTLASDSYTASGCYFVDETAGAPRFTRQSLGASFRPADNMVAGVSLFREESTAGNVARTHNSMASSFLRSDPALPFAAGGEGFENYTHSSAGIDLEFMLGISTNRSGDLSLGVQLTRILEANSESSYRDGSWSDWALGRPVDSAKVAVDWRKGNFSGGIDSYYRAPMEFMNRKAVDSVATFDVHFTWRTPWNANLSVGAANVLNAGSDNEGAVDTGMTDPFEAVYGRIPYVRYQQDL